MWLSRAINYRCEVVLEYRASFQAKPEESAEEYSSSLREKKSISVKIVLEFILNEEQVKSSFSATTAELRRISIYLNSDFA
jgi:hypothetical protein